MSIHARRPRTLALALVALLAAAGASAGAASAHGRDGETYRTGTGRVVPVHSIRRTEASPVIDGRLDDPAWVAAETIADSHSHALPWAATFGFRVVIASRQTRESKWGIGQLAIVNSNVRGPTRTMDSGSGVLPMRVAAVAILFILARVPAARAGCFSGDAIATANDTNARFFHRATVLSTGHVMVSGGMGLHLLPPSLFSLDAIAFYDPVSQSFSASWSPTAGGDPVTPRLITARSSHTQTTLADGRVLITGGRTGATGSSPGTAIASVEVFDPATGAVTAGPAMSVARAGHTATLMTGGRVVVAGGATWQVFAPGTDGTGPDGGDAWSSPHALRRSRTDHAAVRVRIGAADRVLLVAGSGSGPASLELLDPATGGSTLASVTLATGVDDVAATRLPDGTVLIVGGQDLVTGNTIDTTYRYRPDDDRLDLLPPPPGVVDGVADHQLVTLGRFAMTFGGEQQVQGVDCELDHLAAFDTAADDWVYEATMNAPHDDFASAVIAETRVLLVGGGVPFLGQEAPSAAVEIFTPDDLYPPDLDGDGFVGFAEILRILASWGPCSAACPADVTGDHEIGFADILRVLAAWGACPP